MLKKFILILLFIFFSISSLYSQCALYEVPISDRIQMSTIIIEGRVISNFSFWDSEKRRIYTSNKVEIFKLFKGTLTTTEVEIITEGGIVGNEMLIPSSLLRLKQGDIGIFICSPSSIEIPPEFQKKESIVLDVVASMQGFIKYDLHTLAASDVFNNYPNIKDVYKHITKLTNKNFLTVKKVDITSLENNVRSVAVPVITGFSPDSITAGTSSVLTISGNGFGLVGSGSVGFKNADDGGATYIEALPSQIISWSDTQIKVKVPSNAGTGKIRVTTDGIISASAGNLKITYALSNVTDNNFSYESRFVDQEVGGYVWHMHNGFDANTAAKTSFLRAFTNWRCATFVNWSIGDLTTVNITESDKQNVIRFDIGNELPSGVLGLCYSYYSSCRAGIWYLTEFDILFDDATNWQYGPALPLPSQFDFESITLHELGHGHQLGHVINPSDLMHYAFSGGSHKRVLNNSNIACGIYVMSKSTTGVVCEKNPMKPLNPLICNDPAVAIYEFDGIKVTPNPFITNTRIGYQFSSESSVKIELYNALGQKISTLLDETQAAGIYEYDLNGKEYGLTNGSYILKLILNGKDHTKKIINITSK